MMIYDYSFSRKYEEIYPPDVGEFAYITDDTYTKQQVNNLSPDLNVSLIYPQGESKILF